MAGSVNKVILVGNLGRDPEVRYTQSNQKIVHLSVATSERWKDRQSGDPRERTEWHRVVIFNEHLADIAERYLSKGSPVYLEGTLQTRRWTDQGGQERYTSSEIQKAADNLKANAAIAYSDTTAEAARFEKVINQEGKNFEKWFCNLMTGGAYNSGRASCGVEAGVGHDDKGVYTYNPSQPDVKYRGDDNDPPTTPTNKDLKDLQIFAEGIEEHYWEYDDSDIIGIRRFLPADYVLGNPWPSSAGKLMPPTLGGVIRGWGKKGGGYFLAPRGSKSVGVRFHGGVDYITQVGDPILSPVTGYVLRMKNPNDKLQGLLIRTDNYYTASVYYVTPTPEIVNSFKHTSIHTLSTGIRVEAGKTIIGRAQDLHIYYPVDTPQHVHVTLEDPDGWRVSPDARIVIKAPINPPIRRKGKPAM